MLKVYQKSLIRCIEILTPFAIRVPQKIKNKILRILISAITCCAIFYTSSSVSVHLLFKCIFGGILLAGIIFFSIEDNIKEVRLDRGIVTLWVLFGSIRLLTGIVTSVEFLPLACIWLVGFPSVFLIWNSRKDYDVLFSIIYDGVVYPILTMIILSFAVIEISDSGYGGITGNTNSLGQYICVAFPLVLAKMNKNDSKLSNRIFEMSAIILLSIATLLTQSRTTSIVVIICFIVWLIYTIIYRKYNVKIVIKNVLIMLVLGVCVFFAVIKVNSEITHLSLKNEDTVATNIENEDIEEEAIDEQITIEEDEETEQKKISSAVNGYLDRMQGKDKTSVSLDDYSSGRIGIWIETIKSLNILGHPSRDHIVTYRNGDVGNNAHNNFLQFAYDNGILAGICFFLLVLIAFVKILSVSKKTYATETALYISISYISTSLFTSINLPFLYIISFVYYLCYAIFFDSEMK